MFPEYIFSLMWRGVETWFDWISYGQWRKEPDRTIDPKNPPLCTNDPMALPTMIGEDMVKAWYDYQRFYYDQTFGGGNIRSQYSDEEARAKHAEQLQWEKDWADYSKLTLKTPSPSGHPKSK